MRRELRFDSTWEADCWDLLVLRQKARDIRNLKRQVRIPLHVASKVVGHLVVDFAWNDATGSHWADAKSEPTKTQMFRWKTRHAEAEYGIRVETLERVTCHP